MNVLHIFRSVELAPTLLVSSLFYIYALPRYLLLITFMLNVFLDVR